MEVFEAIANCVEETMFTVFNRARNAHPGDQDWDVVTYNGDLELNRSRVERENEYWGQVLSFTATFEVDQRGEI